MSSTNDRGGVRPPLPVAAAAFVSSFDRFAVGPLLILVSADLGVSLAQALTIASTYYFDYGVSQPLWGMLSDRFGRLLLMRFTLLGAALMGIASAAAHGLTTLIIARALTGALFGAVIPALLTYVGDTVVEERRQPALADLMAAVACGSALAGVICGGVDWRVVFASPVLVSVVWALALGRLTEPPRVAPAGRLRTAGRELRNRWVLAVLLLAFVEGVVVLAVLTLLGGDVVVPPLIPADLGDQCPAGCARHRRRPPALRVPRGLGRNGGLPGPSAGIAPLTSPAVAAPAPTLGGPTRARRAPVPYPDRPRREGVPPPMTSHHPAPRPQPEVARAHHVRSDRRPPHRTPGPAARLAIGTAAVVLVASGLAACESGDTATVVTTAGGGPTTTVDTDDSGQATVLASQAAYESADLVVLGPEDTAEAVAGMSADTGIPGLLGDPAALADELDRLGAETVLVPAGTGADAGEGREVLEFDPADLSVDGDVPEVKTQSAEGDSADGEAGEDDGGDDQAADGEDGTAEAAVTLLLDPADADGPAVQVSRASVEAAGGRVVEAPGADPRATADTVAAVREGEGDTVVALGEAFGDAQTLDARLATARTAPELPGGGQLAFPGRRMVAAYGSPGIPSLGILGEQDLDGTVKRVKELAASYDGASDVPVIPAMEIITTVASSQPGADGDYSSEIDPETLRPWIDRAAEEGIYVVLDLQPGTTHFLEQAKLYEDLLEEPHVGLALDPEWRLKDGQRHLAQIGSVTAEEVNAVSTWLADLTAENGLPQKVFVLHQFSHSMISDREDIDASRDELAVLFHADGHGTPDLKMGTWNNLKEDLPAGARMAWKNFYDEDTPTFTPEQTMEVDPAPWFVSYQ